MDAESVDAILCELEAVKRQNADLRALVRAREVDREVANEDLDEVKRELAHAYAQARDARQAVVVIQTEKDALQRRYVHLEGQLEESQLRNTELRASYDQQDDTIVNLLGRLGKAEDEARHATGRVNRLEVENERLRQEGGFTDEGRDLLARLVKAIRRIASLLLRNQGLDPYADVPDPRNMDDLRHLVEAVEHALNDSGVPGA